MTTPPIVPHWRILLDGAIAAASAHWCTVEVQQAASALQCTLLQQAALLVAPAPVAAPASVEPTADEQQAPVEAPADEQAAPVDAPAPADDPAPVEPAASPVEPAQAVEQPAQAVEQPAPVEPAKPARKRRSRSSARARVVWDVDEPKADAQKADAPKADEQKADEQKPAKRSRKKAAAPVSQPDVDPVVPDALSQGVESAGASHETFWQEPPADPANAFEAAADGVDA